MMTQQVDRGKPAEYGHEIVRRRARLTTERVDLKNKVVLDFGCGNGAQTSQLLEGGCRVLALDIDFYDLRKLSEYLSSSDTSSAIPVQYDGARLPIASNAVDVAVSYEVLEHVQDESVALSELHRVLKTGGNLVVSVPNKWWIFETHGARLPLLPWNRVPFFSWLPAPLHRRFARARIYRRRDILRLLRQHGFTVIDASYITAPLDVVPPGRFKDVLRRTIFRSESSRCPFISTSILVHARRN